MRLRREDGKLGLLLGRGHRNALLPERQKRAGGSWEHALTRCGRDDVAAGTEAGGCALALHQRPEDAGQRAPHTGLNGTMAGGCRAVGFLAVGG